MAGELFINDRLVDLDQSIPFPLTFNISDIKDLTARKGNKSKTIKLPGTRRNHELMLSVFTLSTIDKISDDESDFVDFDPSIKATARYYQNGLLEFNGVAQLMECTLSNGVWSFDMTLVSDTIDYIARLQKIKVNELGWSEYNHALTLVNQQNSWSGLIEENGSPAYVYSSPDWDGRGYYYGLIDYGYTRPTPSTFGVEHMPPQVFVYEVLEKAFAYAGITWTSTFMESQLFKRLLLAYAGGDLPTIDSTQSNNDSAFTTEQNNAGGFIINQLVTSINDQDAQAGFVNTFDQTFADNYDAVINQDNLNQLQSVLPLRFVSATEALFKINYHGDHDVSISISGNGSGAYTINGSYQFRIFIYKNNIAMSNDIVYTGAITSTTTSITFSFNYEREYNLEVNDEITIKLGFFLNNTQIQRLNITNATTTIQVVSNTADLDIIKAPQTLSAGGTVNLAAFLPDMTCDVFLKGIITAFNLFIKPSVADPSIVEIEPLNDFYNAAGDAIDWTYLIDKSKDITVTPTINFAAKNYKFNFEQDDDYFNTTYSDDVQKQYGQFLIQSQSQFATNDASFKLPFSQKLLARIPEDSPSSFTDLIVPRSFQIKTNEDGTSTMEKKKGKPFIVQLGELRAGVWEHRSETGVDDNLTDYPYVGHLDSIDSPSFDFNFGVPDFVFWSTSVYTTNNLYIYHEKFIKELVSRFGKQLTCSAMLAPEHINALDFKNLINIDGIVYRLQKVSDYDSGKNTSTQIELIRIIEGEGIQTTTVVPPFDPFTDPLVRFTQVADIRITQDGTIRQIQA
jgi:hypothetical protein